MLKSTSPTAYLAAQALTDKKAENVRILDLRDLGAFTQFFVICSAMTDRHAKTLADNLETHLKQNDLRPLTVEGSQEGRWILLDYGDVVVHILLDAIRGYYDLESLWARAKPIALPEEFFAPAASPIEPTNRLRP